MPIIELRNHFNSRGNAKHGFDTFDEADRAAKDQQQRRGSNRRPYRAYRCTDCDKFHIGRKPASKNQKARARARARRAA